VKALGENLDWVAVMTYDFHGQWDKKTGHVAPMYFHPDDDFFFFNAVRSSDPVCKYKFEQRSYHTMTVLFWISAILEIILNYHNVFNDIANFQLFSSVL
jgi:hypothetical protein